jgi:glutaconate CoA-transferase, subunit A
MLMDKRISMQQAVDQVSSGACLGLGGLTLYRRPVMFVRALVRKFMSSNEPKDLTLLAFTAGLECDLLVGAGMVSKVRSCYFGMEVFGLAPMFTYYANRGEINVLEETEASLASGLRAKLAGIGFMPSRAWLGTDLPRLRPDVKTVLDPYTGEELMAFPAISPDVSVIHALRADYHGNAQIGNNQGIDEELCLASSQVIVTAEEIVPELTKADLVSPFVTGVVLAPGGALPTSCHPMYPLDGSAILAYTEQVSEPSSYHLFVENWPAGS